MYILLLSIIYVSFISLGLPDGLLGAGWPSMYPALEVPVSYAGIVSMTISGCTIVSSLMSDRVIHRFGTGKVTAVSVAMTAAALFGFSFSTKFWMLLIWALPYGLGAGSVDAALNNFVALHYKAKHMSWLHCFWGLGATAGPYIMGFCLSRGQLWTSGYRTVGIIQVVLTAVLFISLPLWKQKTEESGAEEGSKLYSLREVIRIPGAKQVLITFFCYSAIETTTGLWGSSYMVGYRGISAEKAASWISLYFLGITLGRGICGFITLKLNDRQMIRLGQGIILLGLILMLVPAGDLLLCAGLLLVGLGCAPVYPSIIHSTPENFGREASQSMVGVQMACAYCGSTLMPPAIGFIVSHTTMALFPVLLLVFLLLMLAMSEWLWKIKKVKA